MLIPLTRGKKNGWWTCLGIKHGEKTSTLPRSPKDGWQGLSRQAIRSALEPHPKQQEHILGHTRCSHMQSPIKTSQTEWGEKPHQPFLLIPWCWILLLTPRAAKPQSTCHQATRPKGESLVAVVEMFKPTRTHWVPDLTSCGDVELNPGPEQTNSPTEQNPATAALVRTNEKRKDAWKKYTEIRDKVKDNKRPRDDAHNKALTTVKDVLADFSKQATAYQHPPIEKLKEQITEINKQLLQVHEQQDKAQDADLPQLRDQEHFLFEQVGRCLDQVTHLVVHGASSEAVGTIENQGKTI